MRVPLLRPRLRSRGADAVVAASIAGVVLLGLVVTPASASAAVTDWHDVTHSHVSGQDSYLYDRLGGRR